MRTVVHKENHSFLKLMIAVLIIGILLLFAGIRTGFVAFMLLSCVIYFGYKLSKQFDIKE